jgi:hypothetical protein
MCLLLLFQQCYGLGLSWNRWNFTLFANYLESLGVLRLWFHLFALGTIDLFEDWILYATETKATI